jgi:hypothetical protein
MLQYKMYAAPPSPGEPVFLFSRALERDAMYATIGTKQDAYDGLLPGVEAALRSMRVGGRRKAVVPPALGYGDVGMAHVTGMRTVTVPPNATLLFYLEVARGGRLTARHEHEVLR